MGQVDGFAFGEGRPRLRPGLRVTHLGDERLVLDPASGRVHRITGAAVEELDRVLAGRDGGDDELSVVLADAGVIDAPAFTRREALTVSTSAALLVSSVLLPSAAAASSTLSFTTSGGGSIESYSPNDGSTIYNAYYSLLDTTSSSEYVLTVGPGDRAVQAVLVGSGGSGGAIGDVLGSFYGGGGGGGEVAYVDLGTVPSGTQLRVTVAGLSNGTSGTQTTIAEVTGSGDVVLMTAKGGGLGAQYASGAQVPAAAGGSGGGGSSGSTTAGTASTSSSASGDAITSVTASGYANAGGTGVTGAGGGGGGSAASGTGADGSGTAGGDGGSGRTLAVAASTWDFSGLDASVSATVLGAGGGGAGTTGGSSTGAGDGGFANGDVTSTSGAPGAAGSGGGGGGGISHTDGSSAGAGRGGSGAAWVRIAAAT